MQWTGGQKGTNVVVGETNGEMRRNFGSMYFPMSWNRKNNNKVPHDTSRNLGKTIWNCIAISVQIHTTSCKIYCQYFATFIFCIPMDNTNSFEKSIQYPICNMYFYCKYLLCSNAYNNNTTQVWILLCKYTKNMQEICMYLRLRYSFQRQYSMFQCHWFIMTLDNKLRLVPLHAITHWWYGTNLFESNLFLGIRIQSRK